MAFVGRQRRALVGELGAVFDGVAWSRTPSLVCVESPVGWGKTRVLQEFYAELAGSQPDSQQYWPASLPSDRHTVDPGCFAVDSGVQLPWFWSGVQCQPGPSQPVLRAHIEQLNAHLDVPVKIAERNRAMKVAVGSAAGLAAGYRYVDAGTAIGAAGTLMNIARAAGKQRDLRTARERRAAGRNVAPGSGADG